jgi:hypothetical protein
MAATARAQEQDSEGCKDSPLISRFPGGAIHSCENKEYEQADFPISDSETKHGITAARLTAKGLGQTKPIADNTTDDGRAKNRRVELPKM